MEQKKSNDFCNGTSQKGVNEMNEEIDFQFSKHYGRLIEDLKQIKGFTPVMEKVISINISKLHEDINELTKGEKNGQKTSKTI